MTRKGLILRQTKQPTNQPSSYSLSLPFDLFIFLFIFLLIFLSFCVYVCIYVYVCMCVCVCVCVSPNNKSPSWISTSYSHPKMINLTLLFSVDPYITVWWNVLNWMCPRIAKRKLWISLKKIKIVYICVYGLVSLFNGISTSVGYSLIKTYILK